MPAMQEHGEDPEIARGITKLRAALMGDIPDDIPEELQNAATALASSLAKQGETSAILSSITDSKAQKTLQKLVKKGVAWAPKEVTRLAGMLDSNSVSETKRSMFADRKALLEFFIEAEIALKSKDEL